MGSRDSGSESGSEGLAGGSEGASEDGSKARYDAAAGTDDRASATGSARPVSTAVLVAAIVLPLVLLVVALILVRNVSDEAAETAASEPVTAVTLPSPGAESEECLALVESLPDALGKASRVPFTEPAPAGAAAYRLPDAEPVVVRCGLPAPPTFVVGTTLQEVNGVQWFNEPDPDPAVTSSTWVAVDRPQYVAVTLPGGSGTGPIQDVSDALTRALETVEPRPAPIG